MVKVLEEQEVLISVATLLSALADWFMGGALLSSRDSNGFQVVIFVLTIDFKLAAVVWRWFYCSLAMSFEVQFVSLQKNNHN